MLFFVLLGTINVFQGILMALARSAPLLRLRLSGSLLTVEVLIMQGLLGAHDQAVIRMVCYLNTPTHAQVADLAAAEA